MVSIRPSGSSVTVGYQRPNAILGRSWTKVPLAGSKMLVTSMPLPSGLVSAGDQEPAVGHERVPGAEEHRVHLDLERGRRRSARRIPEPRHPHRRAAGLELAPAEELAVGSRMQVQRHDVPVHQRAPLARRGFRRQRREVDGGRGHAARPDGELERLRAGAADAEVAELGEARRVGRRGGGAFERPAARGDAGGDHHPGRRLPGAVLHLDHRLHGGIETSPVSAEVGGLVVIVMPSPPAPSVAVAVKRHGRALEPRHGGDRGLLADGGARSVRVAEALPSDPVAPLAGDTSPPPSTLHWTVTPKRGLRRRRSPAP